jgi:hypothetical protein
MSGGIRFQDLALLPDLRMFNLEGSTNDWAGSITSYLKGLQEQRLAIYDRTGNLVVDGEGNIQIDTPHLVEDAAATLSMAYSTALNTQAADGSENLQSVEFFSQGLPVLILVGFLKETQLSGDALYKVQLDGSSLYEWYDYEYAISLGKQAPVVVVIADQPTPGYHTYRLRRTVSGYSSGTEGTSAHFIAVLEVVR